MISINRFRFGAIRSLLVISLLALTLMASTTASRGTKATFQELGQMPGVVIQAGQCGTEALSLSGDGNVIVGFGCLGNGTNGEIDEAFRWTAAGGYQVLGKPAGGTSDARAASLDGSVVVGNTTDSSFVTHGYRWTAAQGMVQIPCRGGAVTDDGAMVAGGNCWVKTTGQTGTFGNCSDTQISLAMFDLSADGSVAAGVGPFGTPFMGDFFNAYRSTPAGNCQNIDAHLRNSDASGISANGLVIVGEFQPIANGPYHAFRWTAATGMVDLGTLNNNTTLSNALATNQDGSIVVGTSLATGSSGSNHAFVWTAKCGIQDLQVVLKNQGAKIPSGWILQSANDISEDGAVITGFGISPPVPGSNFGQTEPWRAVLPVVCP